jgi:hypothetical protein
LEKEMSKFDTLIEGLWANINKKKKSGRKSSHKNSKAYKKAVKAGKKLEASNKAKGM